LGRIKSSVEANHFEVLDALQEALNVRLSHFDKSPAAQQAAPRAVETGERLFRMKPETASSLASLGGIYAQAGKMAATQQKMEEAEPAPQCRIAGASSGIRT
jgi:hypothetical protein